MLKNYNEEILVSIVIPTYNRKEVISRAVDSCLRQTYNNIEVIICDDHSNDGTLDFIKNMYAYVDNVRCFSTPQGKKGANAARNEGIRNAKGEFVAFLDSDDYLLDDSIENRIKVLLKEECALVYGDVYTKWDNADECQLVQFEDISIYNQKNFLVRELSLCCMTSIMIRKSIIWTVGYLDEDLRSWQDDDLVVSVGMKYKMLHCRKAVAVMISSSNSITKSKENLYRGCADIVKKHKKEIIEYASFLRYCIWKMRIVSLWGKYKEQVSERGIYKVIYYIIDNFINRFFKHIYA